MNFSQTNFQQAIAKTRGVALIEVLVAMVILAAGLLGLAGLQLRGMQVNQGSAARSQAAILAEDLADRMRADSANVQTSLKNGNGYIGVFTPASFSGASAYPALQDWLAGFSALPAGGTIGIAGGCQGKSSPCVVVSAPNTGLPTPPTPIEIDVYWNDARATLASTIGTSRSNASARTAPSGSVQTGFYHMVAELGQF